MKLIRGPLSCTFPSLKLFREDIEAIMEVFNPDGDAHIVISDGHNEYDSLDELKEHKGNSVEYLFISSDKPNVYLELSKRQRTLRLAMGSDRDEAEKVYYRARHYLTNKRRELNYWLVRLSVVFGGALLAALFLVSLLAPKVLSSRGAWLLFLWPFLSIFLLFAGGGMFGHLTFYFVSLQRSHEVGSFWRQYKHDIINNLISAILGAIVALVVQHLTRK